MPRNTQKSLIHVFILIQCAALSVSIAITSIAFVMTLILSLSRLREANWSAFKKHFVFAHLLGALIVWLAITLIYSEPEGFKELFRHKGLVVIPFIWWMNRDLIKDQWRNYLTAFVGGCFFSALFVAYFYTLTGSELNALVLKYGMLNDIEGGVISEKFGGYSPFLNRLQLTYSSGVSILLATHFVRTGYRRAFFIIAVVAILIQMIILGGRASQLALIAALIFWVAGVFGPVLAAYSGFSKRVSIMIVGVGVVFLLVIATQLAYEYLPPVQKRYDQTKWELRTYRDGTAKPNELYHYTTVRRWESWRNTIRLFAANPLLGLGIGDYYPEMKAMYKREAIPVPAHGHNQFLYFGATGGVIPLLIFIGALLVWWRKTRWYFPTLATPVLVFFVVIFMFDVPLRRDIGAFIFAVVFCTMFLVASLNKTLPDKIV